MRVEKNISLATLTTFKIGGKARYFCRVVSTKDLEEAVTFAKKEKLPILILGGGSNMLISDEGFQGLVIKVDILGIKFTEHKSHFEVIAGAGEEWDDLVRMSVEKGLYGIENLSGIPGTVGAAPVQNIGAYGQEVADTLAWVEVFDTQTLKSKKLSGRDCTFGYRDSFFKNKGKHLLITEVAFKLSKQGVSNILYRDVSQYFEHQKNTKPNLKHIREAILEIRSRKFPDLEFVGTAGSFFKNPIITKSKFQSLRKKFPELPGFPAEKGNVKVSLAWIIENICKFKDLREKDAGVAPHQTLVLCNFGEARAEEILFLAERISKAVFDKTGIVIEPEVRIVA